MRIYKIKLKIEHEKSLIIKTLGVISCNHSKLGEILSIHVHLVVHNIVVRVSTTTTNDKRKTSPVQSSKLISG